MICKQHHKDIAYLCKSEQCDYLPLCRECCLTHSKGITEDHNYQLISIQKAILIADENLKKQKKILDQLLDPYENKKKILQFIANQKKELIKEKQRIIALITRQIEEEINRLTFENKNSGIDTMQNVIEEGFRKKLQEIQNLQSYYRTNQIDLRKSMHYQIQSYLNHLGRNNANLTSLKAQTIHSFKEYETTKHEFTMSRLQFRTRNLQGKPLKKIMNQSPLYFLIDQKCSTTNKLHFFSAADNSLRIYNTTNNAWDIFYSGFTLPEQGTNTYDHYSNRYYWIGGSNGRNKQNSIICYDANQYVWSKQKINFARSSAMSVLIKPKNKTEKVKNESDLRLSILQSKSSINQSNKIQDVQEPSLILIAGGLGEKGQVLKCCQLYNTNTRLSILLKDTNFATFSGTLVNFNNEMIFKIGGLNKFKGDYNVVELVEKIDINQYSNIEKSTWKYIQLENLKKSVSQESSYRLFYANQGAIQINPNEIFVFGGLTNNLKGTIQSYIIEVQKFEVYNKYQRKNIQSYRYYARWINEKPLISADDFKEIKPIIWNKKLLSLQNISEAGSRQILSKEKRLIEFNMYEWQEIENIVE